MQLYQIVREDPYCTRVPAGSNDEVKIVLVPNFSWKEGEENAN